MATFRNLWTYKNEYNMITDAGAEGGFILVGKTWHFLLMQERENDGRERKKDTIKTQNVDGVLYTSNWKPSSSIVRQWRAGYG